MVYVDKKTYHAIKKALTPAQKELINYYELEWHLGQRIPTVEEVTEHLRKHFTKKYGSESKIKQSSVVYYLNQPQVQKALENRGIKWQQHTQEELTDRQKAAALTVMNFADTRPIPDKLDQLGINPSEYYAWLNDPIYKEFVDTLADQNLTNVRPTAVAEFSKKIHQGDWNALKYWFETTGEIQAKNTPQSEVLIRMLIEIIQKHVKDPNVIVAIAEDIQKATLNRTLHVTQPREITGEVVDETELANAKKQLGFG